MQPALLTLYDMVAVPSATPDTMPVLASTVAIEASLLLHAPPVVALLKVLLLPTQALVVPVIALTLGVALMVTTVVAKALHVVPTV